MSPLRQIAAIMFTDIVGYTAMMAVDEAGTLSLIIRNRELQQELVKKYNGHWLKEMGDGTLASFSSATDAIRCAIDIQNEARKNPLANKLRIGIHLGDVSTNNEDIFGEGVNIASRLQAIADPGGIYFSEDIERLVRSHRDINVTNVGERILKNVPYPVKTFAITGPGFPTPGPNPETRRKRKRSMIFAGIVILLLVIVLLLFKQTSREHTIQTIAVQSFENLSANENERYFVDGMTQTLVANLGKVSALTMIGNHTISKYLDSDKSLPTIGRELGIDAVISGSVIREGGIVRITAQLIDATTEKLLWTDSYDRDFTNILKLHSEVARAIVEEIQVLVTPKEMEQLSKAETVDSSAYESLLKGLHHLYKLTPDDYELALRYFDDVLKHDSTNAEALAGIALVWGHKGQWGGEDPLIAAEKARGAARKALQQDPNLPMAHQAMAHIYAGYDWSWEDATREFQKTIELDRNLSEPRLFYADLLVSLHQNQEALDQTKVALELDPLNPFAHCLRGWVLFATGRSEEAIQSFNQSLEAAPGIALSHRCLWSIYHLKGDYDLAVKHACLFYKSQALDETANDLESQYGVLGYFETMRFAADHLAEIATKKYVSGMRIARLYTFAGEENQALDWLEKAYQEHYVSFFSLNVDPHWQSLYDQQRFLKLVAKMNLTL